MRGYFSTGQISEDEKQNILNQHRELYNGYQSLHPKVNNEQPLFVQDFANDKVGAVVNNKGVVKPYTNMGINEGILDDYEQEIGTDEVDQEAFDNSEVTEGGECLECGSGYMEEDEENLPDSNLFEGAECSECGGIMMEGECMECGWKGDMNEEDECLDCDDDMMEGKGKLSDIYSVEDLNPEAGFDYIEGSSNDEDTFEGMHKSLYEEEEELDEIGFTGGGNAPDMDISNIDPAFDFESEGPEMGDGPFDIEADDMDLDKNKEWKAFDFKSDGPSDGGEAYPTFEEKEYEVMESAFADLDEVDISGSQGIYGDMKPAYDFDSDGPGSAGPYQRRFDGGSVSDEEDENELKVDFDEFDPRDKSWEEITTYTGEDEFGSVDEEIKESLIVQRNKIVEMFERMKRF
jgi:hypothetical protein